jgi:hypothetical protein
MNDLERLEDEFKAQLLPALRLALRGRSSSLFSLTEIGPKSSALALRVAAQRIVELRRTEGTATSSFLAASYLAACLKWQHEHHSTLEAIPLVAQDLLQELEGDAT